jgi:exosortase/archaeosortase family protein
MNVSKILQSRGFKILTTVLLSLLAAYAILRFFVFREEFLIPLVNQFFSSWTIWIASFSDRLLTLSGADPRIIDQWVVLQAENVKFIEDGVLLKKWLVIVLTVCWITPVKVVWKALFTLVLLILHYLFVALDITLFAHLVERGWDDHSLELLSKTPGVLLMSTSLWWWLSRFRDGFFDRLTSWGISMDFFRNNYKAIIRILFIYVILTSFILGYFAFTPWIVFLFTAAQKILALLGVEAIVKSTLMIGENGSMFMAKGCLGFGTLFIFAAIVYLTGKDRKITWFYIIGGLIFLNIVNIIRFVVLFIHIQKHGTYVLSIDLHDLYNYIIYGLVFLMWIIWFEKLADRTPGKPSSGN